MRAGGGCIITPALFDGAFGLKTRGGYPTDGSDPGEKKIKNYEISVPKKIGIRARDLVIRVRGAIWSAADQTRASGTALASRLSREVRLPGWLDPGSGITGVGPRW